MRPSVLGALSPLKSYVIFSTPLTAGFCLKTLNFSLCLAVVQHLASKLQNGCFPMLFCSERNEEQGSPFLPLWSDLHLILFYVLLLLFVLIHAFVFDQNNCLIQLLEFLTLMNPQKAREWRKTQFLPVHTVFGIQNIRESSTWKGVKLCFFCCCCCMLCVYIYLNVFVCVCGLECMCTNHVCAEAGRGQKVSYPLELEWQKLVGARSFPRAASASYRWPISPAPNIVLRQGLTPNPS